MPLRIIFCTLWLLITTGLPGSAQERVPLVENPAYQSGLRALRDELPELAVTRFEKALETLKEDDPELPEVQLRLIEALVRSGQLEKALSHFELPSLSQNWTALFWKARALLSLGHYYDAATTLEQLSDCDDPGLRRLATLTRARLLAGLGNPREALPLLEGLAQDKDAATVAEANLLRASLLLDAEDLESAALLLSGTKPEAPSLRRQQQYLEARLALGRKDWPAASTLFRELTEDPRNLPRPLFLGAVLGHSDALAGLDQMDEAVSFLLVFLDARPDTSFLDPFFTRLIPWSTGNDTLQELVQARLLAWSDSTIPKGNPTLHSLQDPVATALAHALDAPPSNLNTFSLYHRALHLAAKNDPGSVATARLLLARLRLENPTHPLALTSLLETGHLHLGDKNPAMALASIEALGELAPSGPIRTEAAELAGRIRFAEGDYRGAAEAFARARSSLRDANRELTTTNHGLSLLLSGDSDRFTELLASLDNEEVVLALRIERALLRASNNEPDAKGLLDSLLRSHPGHRRAVEARLAIAELSVTMKPTDPSMALAQLDSIDPAQHTGKIPLRHLLARLKLGEITGEWEDAITEAGAYLRTHRAPEEVSVLLKLGEAFYLNGNYNQAHIQFLQAAKRGSLEEHREVALFFAAKAALRVGIDKARADGLALLREVASQNGRLAGEARLQMGRAYIDIAEPEKALSELAPLLDPAANPSSRTDALLLAAEARRALGDSSHLAECLGIYEELLADPELPYALGNQVHFLKGLTLEQLDKPGLALEVYYRVINGDTLGKDEIVTEWKWFYDCGFSALRLLEESKRWRSAFGVAIILREAGGYRWEEAAKRADSLQLEHQIWNDTAPAPPGN